MSKPKYNEKRRAMREAETSDERESRHVKRRAADARRKTAQPVDAKNACTKK